MDEEDEILDEGHEEDQVPVSQPRKDPCQKRCNVRIHELATPQKRMFLALWNEHAHHLPTEKVQNLKRLLQQFYAMTPEETAKYFAELRAEAKAAAEKRKLKRKLRQFLKERHNQEQKERAYKMFKAILMGGMNYAACTRVPPLVSIRLRYLSDIILEQLCDLRKVVVPNRNQTDCLGNFLISVADWMAIAIERLYYSAQLTINEMTVEDESQYSQQLPDESTVKDVGAPVASSTPRGSMQVPPDQTAMGPPVASSTPKSSLQETPSNIDSVPPKDPYYSIIETQLVSPESKPRSKMQSYNPHQTEQAIFDISKKLEQKKTRNRRSSKDSSGYKSISKNFSQTNKTKSAT